jgi:hypothetical protein
LPGSLVSDIPPAFRCRSLSAWIFTPLLSDLNQRFESDLTQSTSPDPATQNRANRGTGECARAFLNRIVVGLTANLEPRPGRHLRLVTVNIVCSRRGNWPGSHFKACRHSHARTCQHSPALAGTCTQEHAGTRRHSHARTCRHSHARSGPAHAGTH